jgi:hypothetical protein
MVLRMPRQPAYIGLALFVVCCQIGANISKRTIQIAPFVLPLDLKGIALDLQLRMIRCSSQA